MYIYIHLTRGDAWTRNSWSTNTHNTQYAHETTHTDYIYMYIYIHLTRDEAWTRNMGRLRLVGSIKSQISFAKEPYKRDDILQKGHLIDPTDRSHPIAGAQHTLRTLNNTHNTYHTHSTHTRYMHM